MLWWVGVCVAMWHSPWALPACFVYSEPVKLSQCSRAVLSGHIYRNRILPFKYPGGLKNIAEKARWGKHVTVTNSWPLFIYYLAFQQCCTAPPAFRTLLCLAVHRYLAGMPLSHSTCNINRRPSRVAATLEAVPAVVLPVVVSHPVASCSSIFLLCHKGSTQDGCSGCLLSVADLNRETQDGELTWPSTLHKSMAEPAIDPEHHASAWRTRLCSPTEGLRETLSLGIVPAGVGSPQGYFLWRLCANLYLGE